VPEGDTVWRAARLLHRSLSGKVLTETDVRVPAFATWDLSGATVTETVCPATIGPTPAGVPVSSTSPGSSVMMPETNSMISPTVKTMSEVRPSCSTSPSSSVDTSRSEGSSSVSIHGPNGQKVS